MCITQRRETICCLLSAVLVRRAVWGADGKAVSLFWQQPGELFSQESCGTDNGSEKWLPQLEVIVVLGGLADVLDKLESASLQSASGDAVTFFHLSSGKGNLLCQKKYCLRWYSMQKQEWWWPTATCFLLGTTSFRNLSLFLELCQK